MKSINIWQLHAPGHRGENFIVQQDTGSAPPDLEHFQMEKGELNPALESNEQFFAKATKSETSHIDIRISQIVAKVADAIDIRKNFTDSSDSLNSLGFHFSFAKYMGVSDMHIIERSKWLKVILYEHIEGKAITQGFFNDIHKEDEVVTLEDIFFQFAFSLCRTVRVLHNHGIIHSLIVPRNLLRKGPTGDRKATRELALVGFGYASSYDTVTRQPRKDNTSLTDEDRLFQAPECRLDETHSAFWYPSDIYSIGALLYWLLMHPSSSGDEISKRISEQAERLEILRNPPLDVSMLKSQISDHLKAHQGQLYKDNENILKILDTCLRYDPEERFSCIEEMEEALRIAYGAKRITDESIMVESSSEEGLVLRDADELLEEPMRLVSPMKQEEDLAVWKSRLANALEKLGNKPKSAYFEEHIELESERLLHLAHRIRRSEYAHFEVYGNRDLIINSLCRMLATALASYYYCTVTLPNYWNNSNLGSNGRFLTMNKHMARRGLNTRRLFLATKSFHELSEEDQQVLEWQYRAQQELINEKYGERFQIRILENVKDDAVADFERAGSMVACLGPIEVGATNHSLDQLAETICLNFFSTAKTQWIYNEPSVRRQIRKVRYWCPARSAEDFQTTFDTFVKDWNRATTLENYMFPRAESPMISMDTDIDSGRLMDILLALD